MNAKTRNWFVENLNHVNIETNYQAAFIISKFLPAQVSANGLRLSAKKTLVEKC